MGFDNTVTIVGNMTRDPELRFSHSGMPIATFSVAWNQRRPGGEEEVSFFNITCFRQLAENVVDSLGKGARVVIYGTLKQRGWDTPEGDHRTVIEIIADDVAPSLKWATTEIRKNEKKDFRSNTSHSGGRSYGGNHTSGSDKSSNNQRYTATPAASGSLAASADEEPF